MNGAEFASGALNEPAERAELIATARELVPLLKAHAAETERLGTPARRCTEPCAQPASTR